MKTKNILSISLILSFILMMGCTPQPYFDIPYDANGNVILTGISEVTSTGITVADADFTVDAFFPNAKDGDTMDAELLQRQEASWAPGGELQLLPLAGTMKSITLGSDLKASVIFTRAEAKLVNVGDAVTVVFSGATDSGIIQITLEP
jgi:hypothetical protein